MRMKDSFASSLLVLFFLALSIPLFRQDVFAEDAWMFRGNPAHSGVYEAAGVSAFGGVKWTAPNRRL